jgi:hypothetical protein
MTAPSTCKLLDGKVRSSPPPPPPLISAPLLRINLSPSQLLADTIRLEIKDDIAQHAHVGRCLPNHSPQKQNTKSALNLVVSAGEARVDALQAAVPGHCARGQQAGFCDVRVRLPAVFLCNILDMYVAFKHKACAEVGMMTKGCCTVFAAEFRL